MLPDFAQWAAGAHWSGALADASLGKEFALVPAHTLHCLSLLCKPLMLCAPGTRRHKPGTDHRPLTWVQGKGMYHNDMTPDNLVMLYDAHVRPWQFSVIDLGAFSLEDTVTPQYCEHSCWCNQHMLGSCNEHCRLSSSKQFHMVLDQPYAVRVASRMEAAYIIQVGQQQVALSAAALL